MILESLIASVLISSIFIQSLHIFYGLGALRALLHNNDKNRNIEDFYRKDLPKTRVSVIIPMKNEDLEILRRSLEHISKMLWDKEYFEIIILSDDPSDRWRSIEETVEEVSKKYMTKISVIFRDKPIGGRNGAINEAISRSSGDLIAIFDVDSMPEPDFLINTYKKMYRDDCHAVIGRWRGYSYYRTRIGKALINMTDFIETLLLRGREKLGFYIVPLGSGTLYKREVFNKIGFLEFDIIQDDYWTGLKMFSKDLKTCYEDNAIVYVMVPSTYEAFKIQQSRWAYGAVQAGVRGIRLIKSSTYSLAKKIELLIYAFQYIPTIFIAYATPIYILSYVIYSPKTDPLINIWHILWLWILVSALYVIMYLFVMKLRGRTDLVEIIKSLGTSSALTSALSPIIAYNQLRAFLRKKRYSYKITPKGSLEKNIHKLADYKIEIIYMLILLLGTILSILRSHVFSLLVLSVMLSGYIYVLFITLVLREKFW